MKIDINRYISDNKLKKIFLRNWTKYSLPFKIYVSLRVQFPISFLSFRFSYFLTIHASLKHCNLQKNTLPRIIQIFRSSEMISFKCNENTIQNDKCFFFYANTTLIPYIKHILSNLSVSYAHLTHPASSKTLRKHPLITTASDNAWLLRSRQSHEWIFIASSSALCAGWSTMAVFT